MNKSAAIKAFGMTNMLLEADLDKIERKYQIDLGRRPSQSNKIEGTYFSQFDTSLKAEAKSMAHHYEVFYRNLLRTTIVFSTSAQRESRERAARAA